MLGEIIHERYLIKSVVNESPLSNSYMVEDIQLLKPFFLKMISFTPDDVADLPAYQEQVMNFKQHYHPQIPKIYDVFTLGEDFRPQLCLVSEPIKGSSMSQILLNKRRFEELEALEILVQLSRIIEYLHSLTPPFTHQAIQPDNLLLTDDNKLYLTGYSLIRTSDDGKKYPLNMTLDYTAPEQMRGEPMLLSDLYGLGSTAIEMVTGKKVSQIIDGDYHSHANISTDFAQLLNKLVAEDTAQRPQSATVLKNDLITLKNTSLEKQKDIDVDAKLEKNQMIIPVLGGIALTVALVGLGVNAYFFKAPESDKPQESHQTLTRNVPKDHAVTSQGSEITLKQNSYQVGELLTVGFQNTPGKRDWISIAPVKMPDNTWERQFFITDQSEGSVEYLLPKRPGKYEVRMYHNWPADGYSVQDRLAFEVKGPETLPQANEEYQAININILESFSLNQGKPPKGLESSPMELTSMASQPAESLTFEPNYATKPSYGVLSLGNGEDHKISYALAGDKIYVDSNNNQDLTDDTPLALEGGEVTINMSLLDANRTPLTHPYHLTLSHKSGAGIKAQSAGYYSGTISMTGKQFKSLVYENEHLDGLYRNDGIWIDVNQNELFDKDEHFFQNDTLMVDNIRFQIKLNYP